MSNEWSAEPSDDDLSASPGWSFQRRTHLSIERKNLSKQTRMEMEMDINAPSDPEASICVSLSLPGCVGENRTILTLFLCSSRVER